MTTLTRTCQLLARPPEPGEYQISEAQSTLGTVLVLSKRTCDGLFEIGPFQSLARIIDYVQEETRKDERLQALEAEAKECRLIYDTYDLTHHIAYKKIDLSAGF